MYFFLPSHPYFQKRKRVKIAILILNEVKAHRQRPNRIYNPRTYIYYQILAYLVVKPVLTSNKRWVSSKGNLDLNSTKYFFFRFV